ncbi:MAG: hypothetical protein NTW25_06345 [Candidatus Kapabacteria bacterium]|nr:hypothetical protein [Candidatus Kapabacteria bacterium]
MKKITLIALLILALVSISNAANPKFIGQVADLYSFSQGKSEKLTVESAKKMLELGAPIVFVANKKVYFVYNSDGSYSGKKLSALAGKDKVTVTGKSVSKNGVNVIYADNIE